MPDAAVHVVQGDDPVLRADVMSRLVERLLAGEDRSFALDDLEIPGRPGGAGGGDDVVETDDPDAVEVPVFRKVVTALQSSPFMTNHRVVVIRNAGALNKSQVEMIESYLRDPVPGVVPVLVVGDTKIRANSALGKVIKEIKPEVHIPESETLSAPKGSKVTVVEAELHQRLHDAGVKLHTDARARIVAHLGDDASRAAELVDVLASRYMKGTTIRVDEVEPFLGPAGALDTPFQLTTAIEQGDTALALEVLHRLMHATSAKVDKVVHPMQLMAILHRYFESLLKIDAPGMTNDNAAAVLGGNPYAAKYRFEASRRIGPRGLRSAIALLAQADLDLRGARAIPEEVVMQVLVARLAALFRRSSVSGRR